MIKTLFTSRFFFLAPHRSPLTGFDDENRQIKSLFFRVNLRLDFQILAGVTADLRDEVLSLKGVPKQLADCPLLVSQKKDNLIIPVSRCSEGVRQ